jgi:hypothetical protein
MSQEARRRKELESLEEQYELLGVKIGRLRAAVAVETDVTRKLQQEKQLEEAERERGIVEERMRELEEGGAWSEERGGKSEEEAEEEKSQIPNPKAQEGVGTAAKGGRGMPSVNLILLATLVVIILMVVSALLLRFVLNVQDGGSFIVVLVVVLGFVLFVVDRLAGRAYLKGLVRMVETFFK